MPDVPITLVSVVREPLSHLLKFISWHRAVGVGRFILYFDDPEDPAIAALAGVGDVTCVPCTAEFWASVKRSPEERFTKRQITALTHGYRQVKEGWVAVCDGDEFFHVEEGGLQAVLARVPEDVAAARILPAELFHTDIADGMLRFRLPTPRHAIEAIYGEAGFLVRRNEGMVGHRQGKSLTRAGRKIWVMRQHWAQDREGAVLPEVEVGREAGAYLLHFYDRGYASWRAKFDWRMTSWGFRGAIADKLQPIHDALQAGGPGAAEAEAVLEAHYRALHRFDAAKVAALEAVGCLYQMPEDRFSRIDADLAARLAD